MDTQKIWGIDCYQLWGKHRSSLNHAGFGFGIPFKGFQFQRPRGEVQVEYAELEAFGKSKAGVEVSEALGRKKK